MQIEVTVCDVCKDVDKPTKRYCLIEGRRQVDRDLCAEDATPVESLMGARTLNEAFRPHLARTATPSSTQEKQPAPRGATKKAAGKKVASTAVRRPKRGAHVVSMADIEASKK